MAIDGYGEVLDVAEDIGEVFVDVYDEVAEFIVVNLPDCVVDLDHCIVDAFANGTEE